MLIDVEEHAAIRLEALILEPDVPQPPGEQLCDAQDGRVQLVAPDALVGRRQLPQAPDDLPERLAQHPLI